MCIAVVFFATMSSAGDEAKTSPGEATFKARCILCHGSDGTAKTNMGKRLQARDLHSREVQKLSDTEMKQIIGQGKGNMPPFESQLSSEEIAQVVKYVRQFGKKK
jgi:mono/diheme cytochrome c family protein